MLLAFRKGANAKQLTFVVSNVPANVIQQLTLRSATALECQVTYNAGFYKNSTHFI